MEVIKKMKRDKKIADAKTANRRDKKHWTPFYKSPRVSAIACRTRSRLKIQPTQPNTSGTENLRHWEDITLDRRASETNTFRKPKSRSGQQQRYPLPVKTSRLKTSAEENGGMIISQRTGKSPESGSKVVRTTDGQFLVQRQSKIYFEKTASFPDHSELFEDDPKQVTSDSGDDWENVNLDLRKAELLNSTSAKCCKAVAYAVSKQGSVVSEDLHVSNTSLEVKLKENRHRNRKSGYVCQNTKKCAADRTCTLSSTLPGRAMVNVQTQTFESQLVKDSNCAVIICAQNILPKVEQAELPTVISGASRTVHCEPEGSVDEVDCSCTDVQFPAGALSDVNRFSASCTQEAMPSTPPHQMIPSEHLSPDNSLLYDMPPPSTPAQKRARKAERQLQLERWRKREEVRGRQERYQRRQNWNSANAETHSETSSRVTAHVQWKPDLVEVYFFSTDYD